MSEGNSKRTLVVMTVVIVAAIGGLIAIFMAGNGASGTSTNVQDVQTVNNMLSGIPEQGTTLGNPNAPVTLTAYEDLKCPICQRFNLDVFPTLITDYVKTGKVKVTYVPQTFVGQQAAPGDSKRAAEFALAAGQQNKFWPFTELFYHNQQNENTTYVTNAFLTSIGSKVPGLSVSKALSSMGENSINQQIAQAANQFQAAGFNGTPSFQLSKNGAAPQTLTWHSLTTSEFTTAINNFMAQ